MAETSNCSCQQLAMAETSNYIYRQIQAISQMIDAHFEMERGIPEESLFRTFISFFPMKQSQSIESVRNDLHRSIRAVMDRIDFMEIVLKSGLLPLRLVYANSDAKRGRESEDDPVNPKSRSRKGDVDISTEQSLGQFKALATSSSNVTAPSVSDQVMFDMRRQMRLFTVRAFHLGLMDPQKEHHYMSVVEDGFELCHKEQQLKEESMSTMKDGEETKEEPRYLLVSSGCAICILDLKQSKEEQRPDDEVLALPKRATLKLIDKQLPVSAGLFRLRSYAYMTGGHEFNRQDSENSSLGCELYKRFWVRGCLKGTSRATYRLTVKEEDGKMTLSPAKCNNMELQSPKFWPIVEEIGEEIHVFDSTPSRIHAHADQGWIFSHEVLDCGLVPTTRVPPQQGFIYSHVVVGHRIYALAGQKNLLYENKEWQVHDQVREWGRSGVAMGAKTVWDILLCGNASCVGKAGGSEPNSEELYVLIALVRSDAKGIVSIDNDDVFHRTTASFAYLVTSMGDVVCIQPLHHLFLETKLEPYDMVQGSLIKADTDVWAAIVIGKAFANETRVDNKDYLFIYAFTVKDCIGAVSDTLKKRARKYLEDTDYAMAADFVRVDVKARYIYKPNADFDDDADADFAYFVGLRACFL